MAPTGKPADHVEDAMAHLVLVSGGEPGLRLPLDRDKTVLGRDPECHIVIKEAMARRDAAGPRAPASAAAMRSFPARTGNTPSRTETAGGK